VKFQYTEFTFSETFQAAIDAKVKAEQDALAAQNKLKQIEYEAQQQVIQAQAQANATITKATADAQALIIAGQAQSEYQQLITLNLTDAYLQYMALQNWDGQLPVYYGGDLPLPFVSINGTSTTP
jgi:regulator of protease activity HflC (stomatin/prohibitin superfamily)